MAKKISDAIAKQLKKLGIKNVKTEDDAREKLLAILEKNGIEGMEDEDTESLIDMAESFIEDDDEDTDDAESEETDSDDESEDDEDEDEELADEAEDDEDEDEKPAKKSDKKQDKKPAKKAAKKSDDDDEDEDDEDEKPAKKPAAKKQSSSRGVKLFPQKNEDDRSYFKPLHKVFAPKEFDYAWVSTSGVNIRNNGGNSKRSLVLIENCTIKQKDGKDVVFCNLYFPILNGHTECLDEAGIDYKPCWNGAPMIKEIPMEEAIEIIEEVLDELVKLAGKIDKRLGDNRKKMEASLKKNEKKAAKPSKKSKDEDEDDDDEEDDEPKKKAKKSAPATKKSKKVAEPEDEDDEEDDEEEDEKPAKKAKKSKK